MTLDIMLIYFSAANRSLTEEKIKVKIQELGENRAEIMTILQERGQKGIEEGLKTAAKSMIVEGENMDRIMKYTKLTKEEIEKIKREMVKDNQGQ